MQDKKKYIEKVFNFFQDAKNHGINGNNWWYPSPNYISYDIKISNFPDNDKIKSKLSELQEEFYKNNIDHLLENFFYSILENEVIFLKEDIKEIDNENILNIRQAGRSGGWLEVEFNNYLFDDYFSYDDNVDDNLNDYFSHAKKLEKLEIEVKNLIKKQVTAVNKYLISDDYINDFIDNELITDEEILENYKENIKILSNKINNLCKIKKN